MQMLKDITVIVVGTVLALAAVAGVVALLIWLLGVDLRALN